MDWLLSNYQEALARYPLFSLLGASGVLLALLTLTLYTFYRKKRVNFPIVGSSKDADFRLAIKEGVTKYPDSPFIIPNVPPFIIAPKSTVDQFKQFHDDQASFSAVLEDTFHPRVTGFEVEDRVAISVVQRDISGQISSFSSSLQDEATYSFCKTLGSGEEWTSVALYPTLAKNVALVSSRIFVGRPLSRDEEWVDITVNYTIGVSQARQAISRWPWWTVNVVGPFQKEVKMLHKLRKRAMDLVMPILNAHLCKDGNEKLYSDEGDEEGNAISWFLARMNPDEIRKPKILTNQLLGLSFAAIHTTTNTVTQAIFDLATYREYIPLLSDEITHVMSEDGYDIANDGVLRLRKTSILKLGKLDSFLKESQRINPLSLVSHTRKTLKTVRLSTGHVIPKGMTIAIPAHEIHNESSALYSAGHTKPLNEFDGLRYYNLRRLPGNENRHLFVTTSRDSLAFGHGKHSCPGRFFAGTEIKVIMIEILRNWDFRFPGDTKMEGGEWRRPKNIFRKLECLPRTDACVEFRRKKR